MMVSFNDFISASNIAIYHNIKPNPINYIQYVRSVFITAYGGLSQPISHNERQTLAVKYL